MSRVVAFVLGLVFSAFFMNLLAAYQGALVMPRKVTAQRGRGGWWAHIEKPGWRMDRGPYWFRWMALLAFPIQRWTW